MLALFFESKFKSHQSSQGFRINFCFLKKIISVCLGPNAGPDGLIPWTRFCKVGPVWVLSSPSLFHCLLKFSYF